MKEVKKEVKKEESSSDSSSDDDSSSDEENEKKEVVPATKVTAKKDESSDDSSGSDSSDSDDDDDDDNKVEKMDVDKKDDADSSSDSDSDSDSDEDEKASKKRKEANDDDEQTSEPPMKKQKDSTESEGPPPKLYIRGLPWRADEEQVRDFFKSCGSGPTTIELPLQDDGRSSGTAVVEFKDTASAEAAIELNGADFEGRWLSIKYSTPKSIIAPRAASEKQEGCMTVFVGNLSWDVDEDTLRDAFKDCGTITQVRFSTDRETGDFKGYGHIEFGETEATDEALKLVGTEILGRAVRVDYANDRRQSFGGEGGGRGRGGGRGGGGRGGFGGGGRFGSGDRGRGGGGRSYGSSGDRGGRGGRGGGGGGRGGNSLHKASGGIADFAGKKITF